MEEPSNAPDDAGLSGFVADADRAEPLCADPFLDVATGEVRPRVRSNRFALCEVLLLAAEVCVAEVPRSGVPLRRDDDAVKLPISDLSDENRETKIGMSLPYQTFSVHFDS